MFFHERGNDVSDIALPLLPLREVVVFPHHPVSLIVGRPRSVAAIEAAHARRTEVFLVTQRDGAQLEPTVDDLFEVGTIATLEQVLHLPDGNTKVVVEGRRRARRVGVRVQGEHWVAQLQELSVPVEMDAEVEALVRTVKSTFERYVKLNRGVPPEMLLTVNALDDPDRLADTLIVPLQFKLMERQELLELVGPVARLERVYRTLLTELEFLQVEDKLKNRVQRERQSNQREYWLNEQMKAIQKELGDREGRGDLEELAEALAGKELPVAVLERAQKELRKLTQMNLMSAEAAVLRNWLDWVIALPWGHRSEHNPELAEAARVLAEDHYGLREVKERILEYIAVGQLVDEVRGPILCLVGPPGVGKTSLGQSIARATGRPFARIALGGVRDEAEIRGHRRTYIGAMPGKLIHAIKRAGTSDPVILLDEVDKMSSDFRGDPASALLEVLDPEQNHTFVDHYLDLDYDLSRCTFVCTANTLQGVPPALQDRLEVMEISGYTEDEKLAIAARYLIPKQRGLTGLSDAQVRFTRQGVLRIVREYTKESGVRELERKIARVCRKVARHVVHQGAGVQVYVTSRSLERLLGVPRYASRVRAEADQVGLVKGLAVSPWGGEVLDIEAVLVAGTGKVHLTGRLGDWLKESARAGITWARSRAAALGIPPDFHETRDLHVHYPGNPLKTDGPSAGVTMATALVSALTGRPVRSDTAMTGEISLQGRVLRIGGLREKVLAARRAGLTRVLFPEANRHDLDEIPDNVRGELELIPVQTMDEVLEHALRTPGSSENDPSDANKGNIDPVDDLRLDTLGGSR